MRTKTLINKAQLLKLTLLCMVITLPSIAMAQDDLPCGGDDPYATECSLDAWLWILIAGGIIYGAVASYLSKKRAEDSAEGENPPFINIVSQP